MGMTKLELKAIIHEAKKARGITSNAELAKQVGISASTISQVTSDWGIPSQKVMGRVHTAVASSIDNACK